MAAKQLSDGNPEGNVLGQSAGDKIAFHGATPVCAADFVASAGSVGLAVVHSLSGLVSGFGFANSSAAQQLINNVEAMRVALVTHGILKPS